MRKLSYLVILILLTSCDYKDLDFPLEPTAYWSFYGDNDDDAFTSLDKNHFKLLPGNGVYPQKEVLDGSDAAFGNSIRFDGENDWLYIPNNEAKNLDIKTGEITIIALIKWEEKPNSFVAGMWDEGNDRRQYGLFISLPYYNGNKKVCAHISKYGGPTRPFPYSLDYATSKSNVTPGEWHYIAMTYDGTYIRSYYNGVCEEVKEALIDHTKGFEGYPDGLRQKKNPYYYPSGMGNNGSDFTIGAVSLPNGMGNFFKGNIAELAIFNRCLSDKEIVRFMTPTLRELEHFIKKKVTKGR